MDKIRNIAVLGSTGSIGRQTLDVITEYPDKFKAWLLVANTSADLLIEQSLKYKPHDVVIGDERYFHQVKEALVGTGIAVY
ncbi:MAG: 1-deoxy-D-xylulose-5-phosphate reductoisomerase, partial [Bacteroidales bacterium]|nr:1-deoxy-D-xylulose-5-phosphate reductoisomerase [Candidatus Sodaliphilus aphodohippi]